MIIRGTGSRSRHVSRYTRTRSNHFRRTRSRRQNRTNRSSGSYYSSRTSRSSRTSTRRNISYRARGGIKTSSGSYHRGRRLRRSRHTFFRSRKAQLRQRLSRRRRRRNHSIRNYYSARRNRTSSKTTNRSYYAGRSNKTNSRTNNTSYYAGRSNYINKNTKNILPKGTVLIASAGKSDIGSPLTGSEVKKSPTRRSGAYYPNAHDVQDMKTVKKGSSGMDVLRVQLQLKKAGYKGKDGKELVLDGKFGPNTEYALKQYQKENGLVADGIAGPKTYGKMYGVEEGKDISNKGIKFIKEYEKFKPNKYNDQGGRPTIGYGHLIKPGESFNEPISQEKAEELLKNDVKIFVDTVNDAVTVDLKQNEFDACVSLAYNIGSPRFKVSQTVKELNKGDLEAMAREWREFRVVNGKVSQGLVNRREDELEMFFYGDYTRDH